MSELGSVARDDVAQISICTFIVNAAPEVAQAKVRTGRVEMQMRKHDMPCPKPTAAFVLHQLGIAAYNCQDIELAIRFMSMACAQPEAPAQCHRNHAEILHRCGRLDKAEAAARLAVHRDSCCVDAWDTLGTILFDRGALAESRDCYQKAVQIKPDSLASLNNLAVVLHSLEQFDASEACYRRALSLQSDNFEIQLNLANLLRELKRYREALEVTRRALGSCPENNELRSIALELKRNLTQDVSSQAGAEQISRAPLKRGKMRRVSIPMQARCSNPGS
jgi:tetratricopeptide (TPR) repeat protein